MSDDAPTAEPEPGADEAGDEMSTDVIAEVDADLQARLWLRALVPVLQLRTPESESESCPAPSVRVQFALDRMLVAAAERAARILRSDLSAQDMDGS